MNELDVIDQYHNAGAEAASVGLSLAVTRGDFVLRDLTRGNQEFARCSTLGEVGEALYRRRQMLREQGALG